MHVNAKTWDLKNSNKASTHIVEDDRFIPINRPCDWCGKVVSKGRIHSKCYKKEMNFWLDILY